MTRLRKVLTKSRASVGLQLALAMLVPAKGKAGADIQPKLAKKEQSPENQESVTAPPHLTGRWDFSRLFDVAADPEVVSDASESAEKAKLVVADAVDIADAMDMTAKAKAATGDMAEEKAGEGRFVPAPMTHEEIRLWLSSFNAGPYALLKYKGDVPFEETKNYVPRVLKYYEEIDESEYDEQIEKAAAKWGHDPRMIRAIMATESYFKNDTVSHAGARGLMQVMPIVWKDVMKKYDFGWEYSTGVFEPEKNIEVACAYLSWLRYDFLPRHFETFDRHPEAPTILVRDHDRGVPDRETPRLVAASDDTTKRSVEVASAGDPKGLVTSKASESAKAEAKADTEKKTVVASKPEGKTTAEKKSAEKKTVVASKPEGKTTAEKKSAEKKSEAVQAADSSKASRGKVEVTDADTKKSVSKSANGKSANGKSRVVVRGGNGKKVSISVDSKGKVTANGSKSGIKVEDAKPKRAEMARVPAGEKTEDQGG